MCDWFTSGMKKLLAVATSLILALSVGASAHAAATPAEVWYRYHVTVAAVNNAASDSAKLKFEDIETGFDYDISAIPTGTSIQFGLDETSGKNLTVGTGCCVDGNIDDDKTMPGASFGGGVWSHVKQDGEKVAHVRIINTYDEFKDGKYKTPFGKIGAKTWMQIGTAPRVDVTAANSQKYYLKFSLMSYSTSLTIPGKYTKLWAETWWQSKAGLKVGATVSYKAPTFTVKTSAKAKASALKANATALGLSLSAWRESDQKYQDATGSSIKVENDGSKVTANWGAYLPTTLKTGSVVTMIPPVISVK